MIIRPYNTNSGGWVQLKTEIGTIENPKDVYGAAIVGTIENPRYLRFFFSLVFIGQKKIQSKFESK